MLVFAAFLIVSGIVYQKFYRPADIAPIGATNNLREVEVRVLENQWKWSPDVIEVKAGDTVRLKIFNEDSYDHGFALETFGINKRLFPKRETIIEFTASKIGAFSFYCSVPCGEGHYKQTGTFIVKE